MVRVNRLTNCSSYWLTLTPAISVRHFSVTLRNMGTFKNYECKTEAGFATQEFLVALQLSTLYA